MFKYQSTLPALLMVAGVIGMVGSAHADIKYTTEMRMGPSLNDPKAPPMMVMTKLIKENALRDESQTRMGPMSMHSVQLTLCDKRQHVDLDPGLKIYTIAPIDDKAAPDGKSATPAPEGSEEQGQQQTGKVVFTATIQDLGEDTIADFKARHFMMHNHIQTSGCAGTGEIDTKMEMWVSNIQPPRPCNMELFNPVKAAMHYRPTCHITFEQHGDTAGYGKMFNGIVLKMRMFQGDTDKVMMEQTVTSLSQAKLDDDPFIVPADYKQVSEKEFHEAQSKAMMQSMMQGNNHEGDNANQNNGANGDNGDGNNANQGNAGNGNAGNGNTDQNNNGNGDQNPPQDQPKKKKKKLPFNLPF